jgi:hypothetical protein
MTKLELTSIRIYPDGEKTEGYLINNPFESTKECPFTVSITERDRGQSVFVPTHSYKLTIRERIAFWFIRLIAKISGMEFSETWKVNEVGTEVANETID